METIVKWNDQDKEEIRKIAMELGADQVQFLALKDYVSPLSPNPRRYLPKVQSFVVIALRCLRGSYMNQTIMRMEAELALDNLWAVMQLKLGKYLEDKYHFDVMSMPAHRPFEVTPETLTKIIGPVSLRHLAVQSGMGVFGRNTLVVHPKWGSMVRYEAILTPAQVKSDPPLKDFNPCATCTYDCVSACPVKAISEDGLVKQNRCTKHSQPYDVGNFMRAFKKAADMSTEELKEFSQTPHFFNLYMASMRYMFYRCLECTRGCPGTEQSPEYAGDIKRPVNATRLGVPFDPNLTIYDQGCWDPKKLDDEND